MALTKNDLLQIGTVIEEKINASEKRLTQKIEEKVSESEQRLTQKIEDKVSETEKRLTGKIEDEISDIWAMAKREFDSIHEKIDDLRQDHLTQEFKMTEMAHKSDVFKLEERVSVLEIRKLKSV